MVDQLNGKKFQLDLKSFKNFDKYLTARGTPAALIKAANTTEAVLSWAVVGDRFTIKVVMPGLGKETEQSFTVGVEQTYTTVEGYEVTNKWTRDGDKLVETQQMGDKTFVITQDYSKAGIISVTLVAGNVTASLIYREI